MSWPRCRSRNGIWIHGPSVADSPLTNPPDNEVDRCERRMGHLGRHRVWASAAQLQITGGLNYSKEWNNEGVWWVPRDEGWD